MEFLHPAMWHDHDIDFAKWLHIIIIIIIISIIKNECHSKIIVAGGSGMTCHWIRPNVHHSGILHLVSISTISPQSTCHSAPVFEILSKSDHPWQKKMTSCRFSRWRISAILDISGPIGNNGFFEKPMYDFRSSRDHNSKLLSFWENRVFCILATDKQTDRRTDGQHRCTTPLSRGGLIIIIIIIIGKFIERLWKKATEAYNNFIDSKYISTATNSYGCS